VFLTVNSIILARGAFRFANLPVDQWGYAIVAWLVPWIIAVMPFAIVGCWMARRWGWVTASGSLYILFIAYNVTGALEATTLIRGDVIAERQHGAIVSQSRINQRESLQQQRDAIAKSTRPAATVAALMESEHGKKQWQWTDGCKEINSNSERKFCAAYQALKAEHGAAVQLTEITRQIGVLDERTEVTGAVAKIVDPNAAFIAGWTGWDETKISRALNLRTPIILEFGAMFLLGIALLLFGLNHKVALIGQARSIPPRDASLPISGESGVRAALPAPTTLTSQLDLAGHFFQTYARKVSNEAIMSEAIWYGHYKAVCAACQSQPLPLEAFRRVAKRFIPDQVEVDGKVSYRGWLPQMDKGVA
jgi:hypothetical protein